jgi:predicted ArsR family transcriptional regulator
VRVPPRDYRPLAELLVHVAADGSGGVTAHAEHVAREYGRSRGEAARSMGGGVAEVLRECGYEPFAAEPGTLRLRNCPFGAVATRYPEVVCGLNVALVEGILAGIGDETVSAVLEPAPGICCVTIAEKR